MRALFPLATAAWTMSTMLVIGAVWWQAAWLFVLTAGLLWGWWISAQVTALRHRRHVLSMLALEGRVLNRRLHNARTTASLDPDGRRRVLDRIQVDMDRHARKVDEVCQ